MIGPESRSINPAWMGSSSYGPLPSVIPYWRNPALQQYSPPVTGYAPVYATPPIPRVYPSATDYYYRQPRPLPPPRPTQVRPTPLIERDKKTAYLLGGGVAAAAVGAGSLIYWLNKPTPNKPVRSTSSKPLKPLLRLEDFKVPPGLETPELRRAKTIELVNAVYPKLLNMLEHRDPNMSDAAWHAEVNNIFNAEFQKLVLPNGYATLIILPEHLSGQNSYAEAFETTYVKDISFLGKYLNNQVDLLKGQGRQPVYYVGGTFIAYNQHFDDLNRRSVSLYELLLHEVNHLIVGIAKHPAQNGNDKKAHRKLVIKKGCYGNHYFTLLAERYVPQKIEAMSGKKIDQLSLKEQWRYLQKLVHSPKDLPVLDGQEEDLHTFFKKLRKQLEPQEWSLLFRSEAQVEAEAVMTWFERLKPENIALMGLTHADYFSKEDVLDCSCALFYRDFQKLQDRFLSNSLSKADRGIYA